MKQPVDRTEDLGLSVFLTLLILVLFVAMPLTATIDSMSWTWPSVFFSLLFIVGGVAVAPGRLRQVVLAIGFFALTVEWWTRADDSATIDSLRLIAFFGFVAITMWGVGRRVVAAGRVTGHRIRGAIAWFLLLGLAWALLYAMLCQFSPGSISISDVHPDGRFAELVFFSFVTLSTLGYGDILPVSPIAQSLATLEALTGQLFLAILVARLVSLEIAHSRRAEEP